MNIFCISGDFSFDSTNIQSTHGFSFLMRLITSDVSTLEQHTYVRDALQTKLGIPAHSIPTAWGDNPPRYEEFSFETKDLQLCKHFVCLLKEGNTELTANGRRYPPDSDHPLFAQIVAPENIPADCKSFDLMRKTVAETISNAVAKFPSPKRSMSFESTACNNKATPF